MKRARLIAAAGLILAVTVPATSWAVEMSEPAPVSYSDSVNIFSATSYNTGWFPSSGPIQVSFEIALVGDLQADLEGHGTCEWPPALSIEMAGTPDGGTFAADLDAVVTAFIQVDIFGFTGVFPVSYGLLNSFGFHDDTTFTPFALDSTQDLQISTPSTRLFDEDFQIFGALDVSMQLDIAGSMHATLAGEYIDVDGNVITRVGDVISVPIPATSPLELGAEYVATYSGDITLDVMPTVEVCLSFGCVNLTGITIPVQILGNEETRSFGAETMSFPLPMMDALDTMHDFGTVEVGAESTWQLVVRNDGDLPLDATTSLSGVGMYSVFPTELTVAPHTAASLAVTYSPVADGLANAQLHVLSNDPAVPDATIALSGTGFTTSTPPPPPGCGDGMCGGAESCANCPSDCGVCQPPSNDPPGDPFIDPEDPAAGGCLCSLGDAGEAPVPAVLLFGLAGLGLALRRRRR